MKTKILVYFQICISIPLKLTRRTWVPLNNGTRRSENSLPFKILIYSYETISGGFECFRYCNSDATLLKKNLSSRFFS